MTKIYSSSSRWRKQLTRLCIIVRERERVQHNSYNTLAHSSDTSDQERSEREGEREVSRQN